MRLNASVLITGDAGFIGTNIIDCLLYLGWHACVYDSVGRAGADKSYDGCNPGFSPELCAAGE